MCRNPDLNWSTHFGNVQEWKECLKQGSRNFTLEFEKCINLSTFKCTVSSDGSSWSCVSIATPVECIFLTRFCFRCPYLIWKTKNSLPNMLRDLILKNRQEMSTRHCCAVGYPQITPQNSVPQQVTVLATFFFLAAVRDH